MVSQYLQHIIDHLTMQFIVIWGMDEDIIHINCDVAFIDEIVEYFIHHELEGGQGICETKEHDHGLEQPLVCLEHGFPLVFIFDSDVVVALMDIQLCE